VTTILISFIVLLLSYATTIGFIRIFRMHILPAVALIHIVFFEAGSFAERYIPATPAESGFAWNFALRVLVFYTPISVLSFLWLWKKLEVDFKLKSSDTEQKG
jgi:hypothetical protein